MQKQMFLVEGIDGNGDPVRALVIAKDRNEAGTKVRDAYIGTLRNIWAKPISGNEWDELLSNYGINYGPFSPYENMKEFPRNVSTYAVTTGEPIFL
jgi:hypothetical protein